MLLDKKLMLWDNVALDTLAPGTYSDVIDVSNLGLEISEMVCFILAETDWDNAGHTAQGFQLECSAASGMTTTSVLSEITDLAPATTTVAAGTLFRLPILEGVPTETGDSGSADRSAGRSCSSPRRTSAPGR